MEEERRQEWRGVPQAGRRRTHQLRVPVHQEEREIIEGQARQAGLSVAHYLREVGQGYPVKSVMDYEKVRELARINGDLGRLGGLLKLWLSNDRRAWQFDRKTIRAVLHRIEERQDELGKLMKAVITK